ncbi:MAG: hypothetical protein NTW87_36490 [Planctomycetota bacterium]|nr:hypothetical protein [Planctomycetota bacterium]
MTSLQKDKVRLAYPQVVGWSPLVEWKKRFHNLGIAAPKEGMFVRTEMRKELAPG